MDKKIVCVSHTHWDREWYLTKTSFDMMLIDLVDRTLEILQTDENFSCFMLDGQVMALKDYLSYRPEKKGEIKKFVENGRLLIGPWYVLPDEYLISGEGHIRNYLLGQQYCKKLGKSMQVGYLPDSFGHPSQIPQILKGLGLENIFFWRGLGKDITKTEFYWEGLDGSKILAINMPYSYGIGTCLPDTEEEIVERFQIAIDRLAPLATNDSILYMQGVDHVAPDPKLPIKIKIASKEIKEYEIIQGSLNTYLELLDIDKITETTSGELRSGYRAYLLGGTISTRGYLKQRSFEVEQLLTFYAEPLAVLANVFGDAKIPSSRLQKAWELYLENMPHDSICGCSIDEVHQEMLLRYDNLETICKDIINRSILALQGDDDTSGTIGNGFSLYNPLPFSREESLIIDVPYDETLLRKVNYRTGELVEYAPNLSKKIPTTVQISSAKGEIAKGIVVGWKESDEMDLSLDRQPIMKRVRTLQVSCNLKAIPPMSFSSYLCDWGFEDVPALTQSKQPFIENEIYKLSVDLGKGTLTLFDKRLNITMEDVFYFSDGGDAGDTYTYSHPAQDTLVRSKIVDVSELSDCLKIKSLIKIPESLTSDRLKRSTETIDHEITTYISLNRGDDLIKIEAKIDNQAKDHRLRFIANTPVQNKFSKAESLFAIEERGAFDDEQLYEEWIEPPTTFFQKRFVSISDQNLSVTVMNHGLHEYEIVAGSSGNAIAITLIRSVGWLSRPDLLLRKGNGGWTIQTPEAQCLGEANFKLAVKIAPQFNEADTMLSVQRFTTPLMEFRGIGKNYPDDSLQLLDFSDTDMILSCLKPAEDGIGFVLRYTNYAPSKKEQIVNFNVPVSSIAKTNFLEEESQDLSNNTNMVKINADKWEITTLKIKHQRNEK